MEKINLSKKIESNEVYNCLINNYSKISTDWIYHQWNWLNQNYDAFNDLIKYFISIALIRDTLKFYQTLGLFYNYDDYYSFDSLQIDKFSISSLSKEFNLPKETMRRKLLEFEKSGIIKKKGKKIFFDRSAFNLIKPNNQIKITSKYLSKVSNLLFNEKKLDKVVSENEINEKIKKNFSKIWLWYYEFQIPMMVIAYYLAKNFASGIKQQKCIALECGLQNGTLAIFVSTQIFGTDILYAIPTGAYAIIMYITGLMFVFFLRNKS